MANKIRRLITLDPIKLQKYNELRKQKFYNLPLSTRIQQLLDEDLRKHGYDINERNA